MGPSATAGMEGRPAARRVGWRPALVLVTLFVLTFAVAQSCQRSQVRINEQRAVRTARSAIDFRPERTQVRLVRQGLSSRPYWAVSFSVPGRNGGYTRLTTVRVDANTGKIAALNRETP